MKYFTFQTTGGITSKAKVTGNSSTALAHDQQLPLSAIGWGVRVQTYKSPVFVLLPARVSHHEIWYALFTLRESSLDPG